MKQIQKISWQEFDKITKYLAETIKKSDKKFDFITGIPRGGIILAVYLSHLLDLQYMEYNSAIAFAHNTGSTKHIIICDDIVDTGITIKKSINYFEPMFPTFFVTLGIKKNALIRPNLYDKVWEEDIWLVFPWEKDDEEQSR